MAIEAIFFDIGDTLVTDTPTLEERIWAASVWCGIDYDRDHLPAAIRRVEDYALEAYVEGDTTDDPAVMVRTASHLLQELGTGAAAARAGDLVQAFAEIPFERVMHSDALTVIDTLKDRGFKIGVVSDWDPALPELLTGWNLMSRLDGLAVSAIVGCMKPDPRLFRHALNDAGVDAARALHIGDFYELDIAGARAAGMEALLFDWRDRVPNADCPRATTFDGVVEYLLGLPELR